MTQANHKFEKREIRPEIIHKCTQEAWTDHANEFLLTKAIKFARNRKVSNILAEVVLEMTEAINCHSISNQHANFSGTKNVDSDMSNS